MWCPRENTVGVGTVLFPLPRQYTYENIVNLVADLSGSQLSAENFTSKSKDHLGLDPSQSAILLGLFDAITRSTSYLPSQSPQHQLAALGLFLVIQFLPRYSNSHEILRRTLNTETRWPFLSTQSFCASSSSNSSNTPNSLRHAVSDLHQGTRNFSFTIARSGSERNISLSASNLSPAASSGERDNQLGPNRRGSNDSAASAPVVLAPRHRIRHQNSAFTARFEKPWQLTPSQCHHIFAPFQTLFILEHLSLMLRVCAAAFSGSNYSSRKLESDVVDSMSFIFRWCPEQGEPMEAAPRFHKSLNCFTASREVWMFDAMSDLRRLLSDVWGGDTLTKKGASQHHFVHRRTIVHDDCLDASHYLCVSNSFRAYVYAASPLANACVSYVTNSTVFLGAVKGVVVVQNCSGLTLIAACRSLVISNCKDCSLFLGVSSPPLFCGENHNITLAPFNAHYPAHANHLTQCGIAVTRNDWNKPIAAINGAPLPLPSKYASLLSPSMFFPFAVPVVAKGPTNRILFALPDAYDTGLRAAFTKATAVTDECTDPAKRQIILAKFVEWLQASGNSQQIDDLVMVDVGIANRIHNRFSP